MTRSEGIKSNTLTKVVFIQQDYASLVSGKS